MINNLFFVRGNYQSDLNYVKLHFPDTPSRRFGNIHTDLSSVITGRSTANMVNNFRYGFTRQAFSQQGDSSENAISFRFVFSPLFFARTLSRVTPVKILRMILRG